MKALIAMSGGVDSSVAALLTQKLGYECSGCTMVLFDKEDTKDAEDARAAAERLGMDFHLLSYKEAFAACVVAPFGREYLAGRTPNPCVECNKYLKFGRLLEEARALGCDKLVTGHYARIRFDGEKYHLHRALDPEKDQSYVLYHLSQDQLAHILFPLGEMSKEEARRLAEVAGLPTAHKADSQDICFVPEGDYAAVIRAQLGDCDVPGDFVDREGKVLGRHKGLIHYTIGQRKGLGLALPSPLYVLKLDPEKNQVILGPPEALLKKEVLVKGMCWISGQAPSGPISCEAKLRYRQKAAPALAFPLPGGDLLLRFDDPQRAPTPGQSAVFYQGDEVLGGGIIQ